MRRPNALSGIKIGIIGTINRDTIIIDNRPAVDSWGGILYNIKYLCENSKAEIIPVANIGKDAYQSILKLLKQYDNLNLSCINRAQSKNNHCLLRYSTISEKKEILKGGVPPLKYSQVSSLLECDLILVNFISGKDIGLKALEKLRQNYKGIIYVDIHSLTLGRRRLSGEEGWRRYLRKHRFWNRYADTADIIQMNGSEFEILSGNSYSIEAVNRFYIGRLKNCRCLIITLGSVGCLLVYGGRKVTCELVKSPKIKTVFDTTGCGDVFAAGFIIEYLRATDYASAARQGNRLAAIRCRLPGKMF